MKIHKKVLFITQTSIIAAAYVALTYLSAAFGLAYSGVQFRLSEALTILPVFTPAAIPGLVIGCVIGNLGSPLGIIDIVFGSLATLCAAMLTRLLRKYRFHGLPVLATLPPIFINAFVVGLQLILFVPNNATLAVFISSFISVGIGQAVVCCGLGLPLALAIEKAKLFK